MSPSVLVNIVCIAVITTNVAYVLSRWAPRKLSPWLQLGVFAPFLFALGSLGAEFYVEAPLWFQLSLQLLYTGLIWTVVSWWILTVHMTMMQGMHWRVPVWLWRELPLMLGALGWLASLTNPWHGLFITPVPGSRSEYGPLWYTNSGVLWTLILCTVLLAVYRHRESEHASDQAQMRLCAVSIALPTLLNATYTLAPMPVAFDPTVVGLAISTSILVVAVYRGQLHPASTIRLEEWIGSDPLPGILVDRNGRVLFANKATEVLFGCVPTQTTAMVWLAEQLLADGHPTTPTAVDNRLDQFWQLRRDPERWVQLERRSIQPGGSELGAAWFIHEETQRVRLDAALQSVRQVESLGLIAGGVAHDFNNLLVSITGNAELGEPFTDSDPARVREYLLRIRRAGEQGADLARQLLTYAGKGAISLGPVDINEALSRTASIRRASMSSDIAMALDLDLTTPPWAVADKAQVAQMVLNLVVNAEEALAGNGGTIRLTSGHAQLDEDTLRGLLGTPSSLPGAFVYFQVEDDGPGTTQETLSRMFDPFFSTKAVGRGLGLASTLGTVRSHHGALEVRTAPGQGARFTIYIPRHIAVSSPPILPSTAQDFGYAGRLALLVDDNDAVRLVHRQMLEHLGFGVLDRPEDLTETLAGRALIDIAVIDLTMPGLSGEKLVRQLQQIQPDLPIILVSGYTASTTATGRVAFLQKPFAIEDLAQVSARVLEPSVS